MFRSLRFRLTAVFLAGVVIAGLVAAAIAFQLLQSYTLERARVELRRESIGLTRLYRLQAARSNEIVPAPDLELATGDTLFFVPAAEGGSIFPGEGLPQLPRRLVDWDAIAAGRPVEFEVEHRDRKYLVVARKLELGPDRNFVGALASAKPKDEFESRVEPLLGRLGIALVGGILVASLLGVYLTRRISRPLGRLSDAADAVARGRYEVNVSDVPSGGEIGHLAERFTQMAARLREAEQQERNFLMSVSHELRTPLTAIRGHVDALREGIVDDPDARRASLDIVAAESARLERLVGDILDLAKLEADRFTVVREEVDMNRLCERAYASFGEEARRRRIEYRRALDGRPVIVSDGDRVLQIITNLLSNAFRWTPDGGAIGLELRGDNGVVAVAVADSGPGIKAGDRERIFRPFWSRDGGGTGLGLAIANELATALGGRIEVESEPGRGSRFELLLPAGSE
ncbi:MAG: HAMP domain-containing histidine kinase [Actinomycetota bacterium]|nr:HAMP domain-containing histidine kinase [Actinomycetota bacterium]